MIRAAVVALALVLGGCNSDQGGRYDHIQDCNELIAAFEDEAVPDTAEGRKALGDEYRARFRELDCSL